MKQKNLWLLVGLPGSGKSTCVKNALEHGKNSIWVSRDEVRFSLVKEDEEYFSRENEVFYTFIQRAQTALNSPNIDNVYIDATHLNEKSRRKTLNALTIPDHTIVNAVFMNTNIDTCIERNNLRQGREKVPESVIHNMAKTLTAPQESEGFDNILILKG